MKIETWSTERLSPYARELRKHEKALPKMVAALQSICLVMNRFE